AEAIERTRAQEGPHAMAREEINRAVANHIGAADSAEASTLLLISDPDKAARMQALLTGRGLRCVVARSNNAALSRVVSDPTIGVAIAETAKAESADPLPDSLIVSELRAHCRRPLAAILLVPEPSYQLLRQIAQSGPADILPQAPDDEELVQAVQ